MTPEERLIYITILAVFMSVIIAALAKTRLRSFPKLLAVMWLVIAAMNAASIIGF